MAYDLFADEEETPVAPKKAAAAKYDLFSDEEEQEAPVAPVIPVTKAASYLSRAMDFASSTDDAAKASSKLDDIGSETRGGLISNVATDYAKAVLPADAIIGQGNEDTLFDRMRKDATDILDVSIKQAITDVATKGVFGLATTPLSIMELIDPVVQKKRMAAQAAGRAVDESQARTDAAVAGAAAKAAGDTLDPVTKFAIDTGVGIKNTPEQLLPTAGAVVGGAVGGAPGSVAGSALASVPIANTVFEGARRDALENLGATEEEAKDYGYAVAGIQMGSELVGSPIEAIALGAVKKLGVKTLTAEAAKDALVGKIASRTGRIAGASLTEGVENLAGTVGQDALESGIADEGLFSTDEGKAGIKKRVAENSATRMQRYIESGAQGVVAGGLISTPMAQMQYMNEMGAREAQVLKAATDNLDAQNAPVVEAVGEARKADTETTMDIAAEQAKIKKREQEDAAYAAREAELQKANAPQAAEDADSTEAGLRTVEASNKLKGATRLEEYAGVKERTPIQEAEAVTTETVQNERTKDELDTLTKKVEGRRAAAQAKVNNAAAAKAKLEERAAKDESRRIRTARRARESAVIDKLMADNPDASPTDIAALAQVELAKPVVAPAAATATPASKPTTAGTKRKVSLLDATEAAPEPVAKEEVDDTDINDLVKQAEANIGDAYNMAAPLSRGTKATKANPAVDPNVKAQDRERLRKAVRALVRKNDTASVGAQNLILQGKLTIAPNATAIGRNDTGAASYDVKQGKMYVYTDQIDPKVNDATGIMMAALHEGTHDGQFNKGEGRSSIIDDLLTADGTSKAAELIKRLDGKNKLATAAMAKARAEDKANPGRLNHEIVAHFASEAAAAREGTFGAAGGVVRDLRAGGRKLLRKLGADLDVNIADIDSAIQSMGNVSARTNAPKTADRKVGTYNMIVGPKAKGYDKLTSPEYKGKVDGKRRKEISDKDAELADATMLKALASQYKRGGFAATTLGAVLDHPALYEQYPFLRNIKVDIDTVPTGGRGSYNPGSKTLTISGEMMELVASIPNAPDYGAGIMPVPSVKESVRNLFLHEAQHAIQAQEGFVDGASPEWFANPKVEAKYKAAETALNNVLGNLDLARAEDSLPTSARGSYNNELRAYDLVNGPVEKKAAVFLAGQYYLDSRDDMIQRYGEQYAPAAEAFNDAKLDREIAEAKAFETYLRDYGETEARNTEYRSRMDLTNAGPDYAPETTMISAGGNIPVENTINSKPYADNPDAVPEPTVFNMAAPEKTAAQLDAIAKGEPVELYHGTAKDFTEYDLNKSGTSKDHGWLGRAVYFTNNPTTAEFYSQAAGATSPNVKTEQVQLSNPYMWGKKAGGVKNGTITGVPTELKRAVLARAGDDVSDANLAKSLADELLSRGHDGVVAETTGLSLDEPALEVAVLDTKAIQPAVFNMANVPPAEDIESPAFKKWFGKSKLVNRDGTPKLMYHGTKSFGFNTFRTNWLGLIFATERPEFASSFAAASSTGYGDTYQLYMKAENPWEYDNPEHVAKVMAVMGTKDPITKDRLSRGSWPEIETPSVVQAIKEAGFDALTVYEQGKNYAVFEPNQLKSVQNNGNFSTEDNNIFNMAASEETPEFKRWFGKSIAKNADGSPRTFYTGTSKDVDFKSFKVPKNGTWFTDDPEYASEYAMQNDSMKTVFDGWKPRDVNTASRVFPVYLKAENPYFLTPAEMETMRYAKNYKAEQGRLFDRVRRDGYDSVIFDGTREDPKTIVILKEPSQIKSPFNSGEFNSKKPDVLNMAASTTTPKQPLSRKIPTWGANLLSSNALTGDTIREILEYAKTWPSDSISKAEVQLSRYRDGIADYAEENGLDPKDVANTITKELNAAAKKGTTFKENLAEYRAVAAKYGKAGEALLAFRRHVDELSLTMLQQRAAQGTPMSEVEKKQYKAIADNLGRYAHTQYASKMGKTGRSFARAVWKSYTALPKNANATQKANKLMVENGITALVKRITIPDAAGMEQIDADSIRSLYDVWGNAGNKDAVPLEQMKTELLGMRDAINANTDVLKAEAEIIAQEIMGIAQTEGLISRAIKGGGLNTGILQKKDRNIAPEIRALMGEITDPGMKMFSSVGKLAEFVARNRSLAELTKVNEPGHILPPTTLKSDPEAKGMVVLSGEKYGPMNGYFVSKNLANLLDNHVEQLANFELATAMALAEPSKAGAKAWELFRKNWVNLAGFSKTIGILGKPALFVTNFLGGPYQVLKHGNINPVHFGSALKSAAAVIAQAANKRGDFPSARRVNKAGVTDSAFVGEINFAKYKEMDYLLNDMAGKSVSQAYARLAGAIHTGVVTWKEAYSMMDVVWKLANFHQQADAVLPDYYKAAGETKTQDAIDREAADITNKTNITFKRALPAAKNVEAAGFSMFLTYFAEVFRTEMNNLSQGVTELQRAKDAPNEKAANIMRMQGAKRILGHITALSALTMIGSFLTAAAFGDDEDKADKIRKLMPDYIRSHDFIPVGKDANGKTILYDASTLDPSGPMTDIARDVSRGDGDPGQMAKSIYDLYIFPRIGTKIATAAGLTAGLPLPKPPKPLVQEWFPNYYGDVLDASKGIGLTDRKTQAWTGAVEELTPGAMRAWKDSNPNPTVNDIPSGFAYAMRVGGTRLFTINPAKEGQRAFYDHKDAVTEGRQAIGDLVKNRPVLSEAAVLDTVTQAVEDERKQFKRAREVYEGAEALTNKEDAVNALKQAGFKGPQLRNIIAGTFVQTVVTKKSIDGHISNESANKTPEEKKEIKAKWNAAWDMLKAATQQDEEDKEE